MLVWLFDCLTSPFLFFLSGKDIILYRNLVLDAKNFTGFSLFGAIVAIVKVGLHDNKSIAHNPFFFYRLIKKKDWICKNIDVTSASSQIIHPMESPIKIFICLRHLFFFTVTVWKINADRLRSKSTVMTGSYNLKS